MPPKTCWSCDKAGEKTKNRSRADIGGLCVTCYSDRKCNMCGAQKRDATMAETIPKCSGRLCESLATWCTVCIMPTLSDKRACLDCATRCVRASVQQCWSCVAAGFGASSTPAQNGRKYRGCCVACHTERSRLYPSFYVEVPCCFCCEKRLAYCAYIKPRAVAYLEKKLCRHCFDPDIVDKSVYEGFARRRLGGKCWSCVGSRFGTSGNIAQKEVRYAGCCVRCFTDCTCGSRAFNLDLRLSRCSHCRLHLRLSCAGCVVECSQGFATGLVLERIHTRAREEGIVLSDRNEVEGFLTHVQECCACLARERCDSGKQCWSCAACVGIKKVHIVCKINVSKETTEHVDIC